MAANMQQMTGAGQMMPQQRKTPNSQIHNYVCQQLAANTPAQLHEGQVSITFNDRIQKTMNLITNIALAMPGVDYVRAAEFGCNFERDVFSKSPNKETYEQYMNSKIMDFYRKRQANESNIQSNLNANAQAQAAQAHAQAQQRALMQAQMGRGMGQGPQQGFQQFPQGMPGNQMSQQPPQPPQQQQGAQQPQPQQQMGMGMGMGMGMVGQAGRGAAPNRMMNMGGPQVRPGQPGQTDMSRLTNADKQKVAEIASKMMASSSEDAKNAIRQQLSARLTPQQINEMNAQGKDILTWYFQQQALLALRNGTVRLQPQAGQQNQNPAQATMMQQQQSQQNLQRPNMMNGVQPDGSGTDFSQFTSSMESIKNQQMNGMLAEQAGQMVVPASNANVRNPTPQPMNQNMPNQQGPNQPPRQPQQQPQQPSQQQAQAQQQQNQNMKLQQMKAGQSGQQPQAQMQAMQAQLKQMPGQQAGAGVPISQSPAMETLNTPISRPPGNVNAMGNQGMVQGAVPFGDQRFNQGIQRPHNPAFQNMLANMTQEQRASISGLAPDRLNDVMKRWQDGRQGMMGMNPAQMNVAQMQQQGRPQNPNPMGQMNPGMAGLGPQGLQPGAMGMPGQPPQQPQQPMMRMPQAQTAHVMDSMDLPPQVVAQLGTLPPDVKKWRELKAWLSRNNHLPQQTRQQLGILQQRQFSILLSRRQAQQQQQQQQQQQHPPQQGGPMQMPNMPPQTPGQMINQHQQQPQQPQQNPMQRAMGNVPPAVLQVTNQEIMQIRNARPAMAQLPDEQIRGIILQMKKNQWMQQQQQQQQQLRAQQSLVQGHAQGSASLGPNHMTMPPNMMQQQPNQAVQTPQPQGPNTMPQSAAMQPTASKQSNATPRMSGPNSNNNNRSQPPNSSPAPPQKSLKRATPDDESEAPAASTTQPPAPQQNQQAQQKHKPIPQLTPEQLASLTPEQRAKYEQMLKSHRDRHTEAIERLRALGNEEQRQFNMETMPDIAMTPQEHSETAAKLTRIAIDMGKLSRGLSKWYALARDDNRARLFFRARLRIIRQFSDGEEMKVMKDTLSIRSGEVDQARALLESMAKDLAASMMGRNLMKPGGAQAQGTPQNQRAQPVAQPQRPGQQQAQQASSQSSPQQQAQTAASSQDKVGQAAGKKPASKANQPPAAPTAAQPPFPFGASSPHGNPNYIGKPNDINLKLPPRKKTKLAGQSGSAPSQGTTPSPQITKTASPEARRASESQAPAKPMFLCQDPECEGSATAYGTEQALQQHIEEEHVKPREDPVSFVRENLVLALGLEPDGTLKKTEESKQGNTPGQDGQDGKPSDPWASATIDPTSLLSNLGFEHGISTLAMDPRMLQMLTPKDTPESSKDSGASEPNSDISEGVSLDIGLDWYHNSDTDVIMQLTNASLSEIEVNGKMMDPAALLGPSFSPTNWDEVQTDFSKPFQFDVSHYSMTS
ncbi:hypothetical protein B0I35DRAFT_404605 [Stachybotrys elegans]|uniref:Mediator complex subunit 15 KIX domain-containing protein n=1 Tax=Stachybotrys elegans TaxID=80388 RepID=A0A8K0WYC1_9HYPO|nr:hypothetical protein B0I35DRAFT_404605 [Stachybotrys elegans]